jgi:hypothetical protein
VADGEWHHLAVALPEGSDQCHDNLLYVDGVLITSTGGNAVPLDTDAETWDVEIGYNTNIGHGSYAKGTIDEVAIFNVALTASEINDVMNMGLASTGDRL